MKEHFKRNAGGRLRGCYFFGNCFFSLCHGNMLYMGRGDRDGDVTFCILFRAHLHNSHNSHLEPSTGHNKTYLLKISFLLLHQFVTLFL